MGLRIITKKLYNPLHILITSAKDQLNIQPDTNNELKFINHVISNLSNQVKEMEHTIHKNEGLIEYKIALDLLYGNIQTTDEIKSRLQLINKIFSDKYYIIVVTEINKRIFDQLEINQKEFITYKMIDIITEHFNLQCDCISICHPSNDIVTIVNLESPDQIFNHIDHLIKSLENNISIPCNISISECTTDIIHLNKLYNTTQTSLKYSFLHGYGNIFTNDLIRKWNANNVDISLDTLTELKALLKSDKIEKLKKEIEELIDNIKQKEYSYNYIQQMLMQIISLICKVSKDQNIITDELDKNKILADFKQISSLNDCADWIYGLIDIYHANINKRNHCIDQTFISKITTYICEHIDKQISLSSVAEEFNISSNYLSKIFKEGTGINFSELVINKKFEKATELLITNQKLKISEIAESLGYVNAAYFTQLFKQKYGMTPLQYRKQNK
jgi:YesN/AraC family two-component response regulator